MLKKAEKCNSCGRGLLEQGSTTFACPNCGASIGRCCNCREQSIDYICPQCQFRGP